MKKLIILFFAAAFLALGIAGSIAHAQVYTTTGALQIAPTVLPAGTVGTSYEQTLDASGGSTTGTTPFTWTIGSGALPYGLTLSTTATGSMTSTTISATGVNPTGTVVMLSGVPTSPGQYIFSISATNGAVATTQAYNMTINASTTNTMSATTTPTTTPVTTTTTTVTTGVTATTTTSSSPADLQAELNSLMAQLTTLQEELGVPGESVSPNAGTTVTGVIPQGPVFSRDLTIGSTGADVLALQQFLNNNGYPVASSGPGSAGNETDYFGTRTQSALAAWQAAKGISPASGYYGPTTRAQIGTMLTGSGSTSNSSTTTGTSSGY